MSRARQARRLARQYPAVPQPRHHAVIAVAAVGRYLASQAVDTTAGASDAIRAAEEAEIEAQRDELWSHSATLFDGTLAAREDQIAALDVLRTSEHARVEAVRAIRRRFGGAVDDFLRGPGFRVGAVGPGWSDVPTATLSAPR